MCLFSTCISNDLDSEAGLNEVAESHDNRFVFQFLGYDWYKFNTTKQCYRSGASAFDQNPETKSHDKKLIIKDRLIVLWKCFD